MNQNIKRTALVLFGLFVTILFVEGLLRVFGWGFFYLQERGNREFELSKDVQRDPTGDIQLNRAAGKEFVIGTSESIVVTETGCEILTSKERDVRVTGSSA